MARIPLNLQMEIRMEQPQRKYKFWNRSFENIDRQHRRDPGIAANFDSEINDFKA